MTGTAMLPYSRNSPKNVPAAFPGSRPACPSYGPPFSCSRMPNGSLGSTRTPYRFTFCRCSRARSSLSSGVSSLCSSVSEGQPVLLFSFSYFISIPCPIGYVNPYLCLTPLHMQEQPGHDEINRKCDGIGHRRDRRVRHQRRVQVNALYNQRDHTADQLRDHHNK